MQLGNPFAVEGRWFRGNTHIHTTNSDGQMAPEKVAQHYASGGYDFLFLTDHGVISALETAREDILVLPGIEVGALAPSGRGFHVIGLSVRHSPKSRDRQPVQEVIDAIREQGGLPIVAHPYWTGLTIEDLGPLEGVFAIEVYNATCEAMVGKGHAMVHWDDLLARGRRIMAVAADDCHRPAFDSHRAWTMVRAATSTREPTPEAVLAALASGHFYCSTGPALFDLQWDPEARERGAPGGVIRVRCSPAKSITLAADGAKGCRVEAGRFGETRRARRLRTEGQLVEGARDGDLLTGADFLLQGNERYARVQVEDERGRYAWSNPLFVRDDT